MTKLWFIQHTLSALSTHQLWRPKRKFTLVHWIASLKCPTLGSRQGADPQQPYPLWIGLHYFDVGNGCKCSKTSFQSWHDRQTKQNKPSKSTDVQIWWKKMNKLICSMSTTCLKVKFAYSANTAGGKKATESAHLCLHCVHEAQLLTCKYLQLSVLIFDSPHPIPPRGVDNTREACCTLTLCNYIHISNSSCAIYLQRLRRRSHICYCCATVLSIN